MINIVCALKCEARPLIDHYGLRHKPVDEIKLYQNAKINLVITGVGGKLCAAAVNRLAQSRKQPSAWLNIGIAGHGQLTVGEGRIIHKITGPDGSNWYPPRLKLNTGIKPGKNNIDSISLITVDSPEKSYQDDYACDMEAAYFYQAATKHQTSELVQCYKIISDNNFSPTENINAKKVRTLIEKRLPDISILIEALSGLYKLSALNSPAISIDELTNNYHFSQYQKIHLVKLLERLSLLTSQDNYGQLAPKLKNSRQVLDWLESKIKELPVRLS
ncbi:MAG: hypothetical protein ACC635_01620 [Acidiferrobacterales bacterium]